MTDEELTTSGLMSRFRPRPMRGAKQIQRDVRYGSRGGSVATGGSLPLYPPFRNGASPSYR
jgi:hypothetical protein